MYNYKIFGYYIKSSIDLCLPLVFNSMQDIFIEALDENSFNNYLENHHNTYKFKLDESIEFLIIDDSNIKILFKNEEDHNLMRLYLLGSVMGIVLLMRKSFAIHGSSICINDNAYIFTGNSGVGKSSIARGLINRGYMLLSDDVSVVSTNDDLVVIPSYPSQKLWKDAIKELDVINDIQSNIANRIEKYNVMIGDNYCELPKKLKAIVELEINNNIKAPIISKVDSKKILKKLIENTYRYNFIQDMHLESEHFKWVMSLFKHIDYYVIERPKDEHTVNLQIDCFFNEVIK